MSQPIFQRRESGNYRQEWFWQVYAFEVHCGNAQAFRGSDRIFGKGTLFIRSKHPGFDAELTGRENVSQLSSAYGVKKEDVPMFVESAKGIHRTRGSI